MMKIRRSSLALVAVGVLLIALAGILRFAVVPGLTKLPADTDITSQYEGTATLLNSAALKSGDTANALMRGLPITVDRHVFVSSSTDDVAVVHDDSVINGPNGLTIDQKRTYALDRSTRTEASAPEGEQVDPHQGLTVALPMNPPADDSLQIWDSGTQATVPAVYKGSESIHGRDANRYEASAQGTLKNQATLKTLPPALPKALIEKLLPSLPAASQDALGAVLPTLSDPVPLAYSWASKLDVAVDKKLGLPITAAQSQKVVAGVEVGGQRIDLLPVMVIDVKSTDAAGKASADRMKSAADKLALVEDYIPLGLVIVGALLIVVGIVRRRPVAGA
ncbi:porin PorA family protein [Nocardia fluminea]|uniref:porin PorA family protein n=1 Tax=Nocardia fluminea TaxID=134984 RepID=UPI0033F5DF2E